MAFIPNKRKSSGSVPFVGFSLSHSFCRWPRQKYVTGNNLICVFG